MEGQRDLTQLLSNIRHVVLDLDGTVYTGDTVFDSVAPFLATLTRLGIGYTFLTNNSSRGKDDYARRLAGMGIQVATDQVFASGDATIEYLREEQPDVQRLFVLGTPSLASQFADAGYRLCDDDPDDVPDLVVVGFDTATDLRCASAAPRIGSCGASLTRRPIPTAYAPRTSEPCWSTAGRSAPCWNVPPAANRSPRWASRINACLRGILSRHRLRPAQLAMVGDRLYTDMRTARDMGAVGVLVLTGETTAEAAGRCPTPPELVVRDLDELRGMFDAAQASPECALAVPRVAAQNVDGVEAP